MVRKSGDGSDMAVAEITTAPTKRQMLERLGLGPAALAGRPAWRAPRGVVKPINLERRARFARDYWSAH